MNKSTTLGWPILVVLLVAGLTAFVSCAHKPGGELPVRVGWPTTWATQGQFTQALKSSGVLEQNGLRAQFTSFPSGPEELEAAKGGSLDVVSAAAQPILQLVAQTKGWVIVSRNAYVRVALLVPAGSQSQTLRDLVGQQIGLPVGTTAENFILSRSAAEALGPSDVRIVNLDIASQGDLARRRQANWGNLGGMATWEPTVTLLEESGVARVIEEQNDLTLTAMSKNFIAARPAEAVAYMRACLEAWAYYSNHKTEMDGLYVKAAKLPISAAVLDKVSSNEQNASAHSVGEVDISLTPQMLQHIKETLLLLVQKKRLPAAPEVAEIVNQDVLRNAKASLR